jgi:hypothetical protein
MISALLILEEFIFGNIWKELLVGERLDDFLFVIVTYYYLSE